MRRWMGPTWLSSLAANSSELTVPLAGGMADGDLDALLMRVAASEFFPHVKQWAKIAHARGLP